jgi:hypothetical protein
MAFLYESGSWHKFTMTSPETLYIKNVVNKLSFLPVTHMTYFDVRFGCYEFLNSDFTAGHILDRPAGTWSDFWPIRWVKLAEV